MLNQRKNILDFASYLRDHPWMPQKLLARGFGCDQQQAQKWLLDLEVEIRRGTDPENGRRNVKLYAIVLPQEKAAALTHKGKEDGCPNNGSSVRRHRTAKRVLSFTH